MKRNILILYSDADEQWKVRLESQIDVLIKAGEYKIDIDFWSEKRFEPGDDWYPDLDFSFKRADLILLMVSENLLNSPIMQPEKVKGRLREKQNGGFPIFIILLNRCGWRRYTWMKTLPVWPDGGKYLANLSDSLVNDTLADVTVQIVEKLKLTSKITEGILSFLGLSGVGPVKDLFFEPTRLNVKDCLDHELDIQFLLTTHSPLVLASLEPVFDEENDKVFYLELKTDDIVLKEQPFLPLGRVDNWFTSNLFGLLQARSLEAEKAIKTAEEIQQKEHPTIEEVKAVQKDLSRFLTDFDTFWPHWVYFAEKVIGEKL